MISITTEGLTKSYGSTTALADINLSIEPGELFFVLGPSGCGKTTLLRILAGLTPPSAGRVLFNDRDVTRMAPRRRGAAMVFQDHALWPHMTVERNILFGLKLRHLRRAERRQRVKAMLGNVHMAGSAGRYPAELSGGECQRVALARALATQPDLLLLDEPLCHLDGGLRLELRHEIRRLCSQSQSTAIYVSHDHDEALSLADRVAVMRAGRIEQVGTPREVYHHPSNPWVAVFCGAINVISGSVAMRDAHRVLVNTPLGRLESRHVPEGLLANQSVTCAIRPECIRRGAEGNGLNHFHGRIDRTSYRGHAVEHEVTIATDHTVRFIEPPYVARNSPTPDVTLHISAEDVLVYPKDDSAQ